MLNKIEQIQIDVDVNGERISRTIEPRLSLVDFLRNELQLTGSHVGCEHGVCGACTVLVDGAIVRGCLMLAIQTNGAEVMTIEGQSDSGAIIDLQEAFHKRNALQCGFCTPGMIMSARALLAKNPKPSIEEIREELSGNLCRCTGYVKIADAVMSAVEGEQS